VVAAAATTTMAAATATTTAATTKTTAALTTITIAATTTTMVATAVMAAAAATQQGRWADKEDSNQLKVAMDNGRGRPRGGGRVLTTGAHGFLQCLCEFFDFAFCEECGLGTTQSVRKSFFPAKRARPRF
jgi:hypothetical protein